MEGKLKALFDFQKFEGSKSLQSVIDSVHSRYAKQELDLDDLEWVNAAGTPGVYPGNKDKGRDPDGLC